MNIDLNLKSYKKEQLAYIITYIFLFTSFSDQVIIYIRLWMSKIQINSIMYLTKIPIVLIYYL